MSMTTDADVMHGANSDCKTPIDLEHLEKFTLGNKSVEAEVLELFCKQSSQYLDRLKLADTQHVWRDVAHTIKGSARGIGAWQVATKAENLEKLSEDIIRETRIAVIEDLERCIAEATSFIDSYLNKN